MGVPSHLGVDRGVASLPLDMADFVRTVQIRLYFAVITMDYGYVPLARSGNEEL